MIYLGNHLLRFKPSHLYFRIEQYLKMILRLLSVLFTARLVLGQYRPSNPGSGLPGTKRPSFIGPSNKPPLNSPPNPSTESPQNQSPFPSCFPFCSPSSQPPQNPSRSSSQPGDFEKVEILSKPHGSWGDWGSWSSCFPSASICGKRQRTRERPCGSPGSGCTTVETFESDCDCKGITNNYNYELSKTNG